MDNNMIEKIEKLLAKAEGTNNEAEAQAFFNGAQRLMAQYGIKSEQLNTQKEINVDQHTIIDDRASAARNLRLAYIIGKNFKCKPVKMGGTIVFIGEEQDLKIAIMTFDTIHTFIEKRRRQIYRDARKAGRETKGIREDYVTGFLRGLEEGFNSNVKEYGLVVVVPQSVNDHINKTLGKLKNVTIKGSSIKNAELYNKGYQDGKGYNREIE